LKRRPLAETDHEPRHKQTGKTVLGMVEAGIGLAVVPQLAAPRRDDTLLATCRLTKPEVSRTILLLRRRDRSLSPAATAVWSALLHLYKTASNSS
jgi:DNA-binding transcriptional LysR family regulator